MRPARPNLDRGSPRTLDGLGLRRGPSIVTAVLAHEAGVDRSYVSLLERGIKNPTLRMVFRLAGILGVTAKELVGRVEAEMAGAG